MKEATSVETELSTLTKQVTDLNDHVSEQQKMLGNKESQIKHLEHVLTKTQSEARLHKLEGSADVALQMQAQISELANAADKLKKDKETLKEENAKLKGEVDAYEKANSDQKKKSAKILDLIGTIENEIHGAQDKASEKSTALKKKISSLSKLVQKDLRLDSR